MRKLLNRCRFRSDYNRHLMCGTLCIALLFFTAVMARADVPKDYDKCAHLEDKTERVDCYDRLAKCMAASTYLGRLWELDEECPRDKFALLSHRSNYFLLLTYVESPNEEAVRKADPGKSLDNIEAAFQLSIKTKVWQDILGKQIDLWAAYTQRSFWQLYNAPDSRPFREHNYEPEVLLNFRTGCDLNWLKSRFINVGINHQSNGQSDPLSRSWNRFVANFGFEDKSGNLALILKTWYRIPESAAHDDNRDIEDYLGYGEIWAYYFIKSSSYWDGTRFGAMVRNNFSFGRNRGALQLEASCPLRYWSISLLEHVSLYIQYFNGYGESMLDYDHNINRIGIGIIIKDWQ
jgi:phospholipase A1/A2